ncbi:MAG: hypothetical protein JWM60_670 [Solirubrobacterales bacterium]|nr:hypothetical protein [Solirubrobacterales bacterium]
MSSSRILGMTRLLFALAGGMLLGLLFAASAARAAEPPAPAPHWKLESRAAPTHLPLEGEELTGEGASGIKGEGMIVATATNLGDASVHGKAGTPVVVTDNLPAGVEAVKATGLTGEGVPGRHGLRLEESCPVSATSVTCSFEVDLPPFEHVEIRILVKVKTSTPSEPLNELSVSGGETAPASLPRKVQIGGGPTGFGLENIEVTPENEDGSTDTRAGSHPFQLTTTFDLNENFGIDDQLPPPRSPIPTAPALQKEIVTKLPPGLLGNPLAVPQCSGTEFGALDEKTINSCPNDTAIGVAVVSFNDPILYGFQQWAVPIFNLEPAAGSPARFGFEIVHVPVVLDAHVRTGEDYGVTVTVQNTSQAVQVLGANVTIWGVPGSPLHDESRGWDCIGSGHYAEGFTPPHTCPKGGLPQTPYLFLPTSCPTARQATVVSGRAWSGETLSGESEFPALSGCGELPFSPSVSVRPDEAAASTPTGLNVEVNLPQETTLSPDGLAESDLKATTLTLPEGLQASAGAANGLETCSVEAVGFSEPGGALGAALEAQQFTGAPASCPNAAKIGTVSIKTPVLAKELVGGVYLGAQNTNPFASPLVLYLAAEDEPAEPSVSTVRLKVAGEVAIDPVTGRLTSTFKNTPQAPFERLRLHLFSGPRASQATPSRCGSYVADGTFAPWSEGAAVHAGSQPGEGFQITSGPGGSPCPGATLPLSPGLQAGSTIPSAGAFSPFTLTIGRPDGQQELNALSVHLPPGIAAMLSKVTPCAEPPAGQEWHCGPDSLIGKSTASSGLGAAPVTLAGQVYLTKGYNGAPFGLLDATLAQAGPFNLGWVYVRSRINVDPFTAAVTVSTDPGPHGDALPTIIKGVPVQLKQINVTVDRPEFQFNPTSCLPKAITATLSGSEGATATVPSSYNVTGCASLPFKPTISVETESSYSRVDGLGMKVIVKSSKGQANIAKTKLVFPTSIPSRLTTIQKACPDTVFNVNPANCPEGSVIGAAIAHTPVLRSPLTGPAYLVSHASASFPDAEFVLQGEGIKLVLDGKTDIKKGITSSTFESVPDAPVETFEVNLPRGPHSAFSGFGDLCAKAQELPTEFGGQNGALIVESTKAVVKGCKGVASFHKTSELAKLLKKCRKLKNHKKRVRCEATARKQVKAVAACKAKNKKSKKKLSSCVATARKRYALKLK